MLKNKKGSQINKLMLPPEETRKKEQTKPREDRKRK